MSRYNEDVVVSTHRLRIAEHNLRCASRAYREAFREVYPNNNGLLGAISREMADYAAREELRLSTRRGKVGAWLRRLAAKIDGRPA